MAGTAHCLYWPPLQLYNENGYAFKITFLSSTQRRFESEDMRNHGTSRDQISGTFNHVIMDH